MPGNTQITINLLTSNTHLFPELAERVKDLSPVFRNFIDDWAKRNREKFDLGSGMESSGVYQAPENYWQQLTPPYMAQKRKEGYADNLMVRTGALRDALSDPEGFFSSILPGQAAFGFPKNEEEQAKVMFNWESRQSVFLNDSDTKSLKSEVVNYLRFGDKYKEIIFEKGMAAVRMREEMARMEYGFSQAVTPS